MDQVGHPIPIKPTQPKSRYTKTCHYGKKPCGISLIKYLWRCELAEFGLSSCFFLHFDIGLSFLTGYDN